MDYKKISEKYFDNAIKDLQGLININSVYDETTITKEKPYGEGVHNAMQYMKKLALRGGFTVDMCDGHCIEMTYGEGEKEIGIFAHLDVVPVNGTWLYPAFSGEVHDGKMYGRGTSDDKGPGIAAFYAMKLLKDNNLVKDYKIRMVMGGDEERGSSCLEYYFNNLKKKHVTYGFTPDGDFPLIYGEKGIRNYNHFGKLDLYPVVSIKAGVASNAVIDEAILVTKEKVKILEYLKNNKDVKYKVIEENNDSLTIAFYGVAAHGSLPEKGVNAGLKLIDAIAKCYGNLEMIKLSKMYNDPFGKSMNQYYETPNMHNTTYNVGIIDYENNDFNFVVNFRYPENVNSDDVIDAISKMINLKTNKTLASKVLYFDPNEKFIKALSDVYVRETGDTKNKPMTIGGGTYAKECKNTVAFGSHFPGKEDNIHSCNEKIDIEDFTLSIAIYADAINTLGNLD